MFLLFECGDRNPYWKGVIMGVVKVTWSYTNDIIISRLISRTIISVFHQPCFPNLATITLAERELYHFSKSGSDDITNTCLISLNLINSPRCTSCSYLVVISPMEMEMSTINILIWISQKKLNSSLWYFDSSYWENEKYYLHSIGEKDTSNILIEINDKIS